MQAANDTQLNSSPSYNALHFKDPLSPASMLVQYNHQNQQYQLTNHPCQPQSSSATAQQQQDNDSGISSMSSETAAAIAIATKTNMTNTASLSSNASSSNNNTGSGPTSPYAYTTYSNGGNSYNKKAPISNNQSEFDYKHQQQLPYQHDAMSNGCLASTKSVLETLV